MFSDPVLEGEFYYKDILWNKYTTLDILQKIERFQFEADDVVIATYPRTGTTLTQEIVWHILHSDIIKKGEKYGNFDYRCIFLEFDLKTFYNDDSPQPIDVLLNTPAPRCAPRMIKTHCPINFLLESHPNLLHRKDIIADQYRCPKIITVIRNPRDTAVSLFHFITGLSFYGPWSGDWNTFCNLFAKGIALTGSWKTATQSWWRIAKSNLYSNVLLLKFEDIVENMRDNIVKIANFLNVTLTEEQIEIILFNCNFDSMSTNENVNFTDSNTGFKHIHKGLVDGWKKYFTVDQIKLFQEECENDLKVDGLEFTY